MALQLKRIDVLIRFLITSDFLLWLVVTKPIYLKIHLNRHANPTTAKLPSIQILRRRLRKNETNSYGKRLFATGHDKVKVERRAAEINSDAGTWSGKKKDDDVFYSDSNAGDALLTAIYMKFICF